VALENPLPVNDTIRDALRPMYESIRTGQVDRVRQLIAEHPVLLEYQLSGLSPSWLHVDAETGGHFEVAELLLGMGLDINTRGDSDGTPLGSAVYECSPDYIKFLLERGADPNIGRTLIGALNREPDDEDALAIIKLLVDHGADVNRVYEIYGDPNNTFTALEWAAGRPAVADYLRSKGAVDRAKPTPAVDAADPAAAVEAYFDETFGPVWKKSLAEIVPTSDVPVRIHVIPADKDRNHVTLFTTGMSARPMAVPDGGEDFRYAELFVQLPGKWPLTKTALADPRHGWPIHWLRSVANYPHANGTWLGGPATIIANGEPPEPLSPGLKFTSLFLMAERKVELGDGRTIQLYRLTPLYTVERNLEIKKGLPALLRAFDKADMPFVVDLTRKSVAGK